MGGETEDDARKKKKPDFDLADFLGASKYYYVDPSANKQQQPDPMTSLVEALDRIGVVPQNEGTGF